MPRKPAVWKKLLVSPVVGQPTTSSVQRPISGGGVMVRGRERGCFDQQQQLAVGSAQAGFVELVVAESLEHELGAGFRQGSGVMGDVRPDKGERRFVEAFAVQSDQRSGRR